MVEEVLGGGSEGMFAGEEGRLGAIAQLLGQLLSGLPELRLVGQCQMI